MSIEHETWRAYEILGYYLIIIYNMLRYSDFSVIFIFTSNIINDVFTTAFHYLTILTIQV